MAKLLLIEDMAGVRDSLEMILQLAGHDVSIAKNGAEGLAILNGSSFELVITDILMPEVDGTEVIMKTKERTPSTKILAISAGGNGVSADQALTIASQKADGMLKKPFSKEELLAKINELTSQERV